MLVQFHVEGIPAPGGSKNAFPFRRADGRIGVRMVDAGKGNAEWKRIVGWKAKAYMVHNLYPLLAGPLALSLEFVMPRPKSAKRQHHIIRPDLTKIIRAVEDGLTGIVWIDDAQIVSQACIKRYAADGEACGVKVICSTLE